ncbi:hypothetical protein [Streptomyces sp. NPDC101455]|uniref:hypothetical protein n=1 Tax=Streptomyces sp. NPDC101455 TaxID=3366142 RepID=UPI00380A15AF
MTGLEAADGGEDTAAPTGADSQVEEGSEMVTAAGSVGPRWRLGWLGTNWATGVRWSVYLVHAVAAVGTGVATYELVSLWLGHRTFAGAAGIGGGLAVSHFLDPVVGLLLSTWGAEETDAT